MAFKRFMAFLLFLLLQLLPGYGQEQTILLKGITLGSDQRPLAGVNIQVKNSKKGNFSDQHGRFKIRINLPEDSILVFSCLNYQTIELPVGWTTKTELRVALQPLSIQISEIQVSEQRRASPGVVTIGPLLTRNLPNAGGGAIEQLVKSLPGVSSNSELSPRYNVRGGNYDENLVYVNGIEIFRPFLIKTGEQEGLSFLNPDLVAAVRFSSGGFESSYGDKMSSVLDIEYKTPEKFAGTAELGALGASAHFEGRAMKNRFSYLTGIRYKDNRYLLGTLDQKGHYDPSSFDLQALLGYNFSERLSINFLANVSRNYYSFTPESRETNFGTMAQAYQLKIYFEGNEQDNFSNQMGALTINFDPTKNLHLQLTGSSFRSNEQERYDILGQYYLNEIVAGSVPSDNPDSTMLLGVGSSLIHANNYLQASIQTIEQSGKYKLGLHHIRWGLKYQSERIHDQVNEWEMRDSAGYSLPYGKESLELYRRTKADNQLNSNRLSLYLQDNFSARIQNSSLSVSFGGRVQYWDFNNQTIFSPRISARFYSGRFKQLQLHAACGSYQQMPFFKELKNREAQLVQGVKAQKSIHHLVGLDHSFQWGDRPFKFSTELWYKSLTHLVPYKVTNLDLQYFPEYQAKGYAKGLEMRLFGEPVPGATSWASFTLMKTEENISGDQYQQIGSNGAPDVTVYPGYLPRPSDQRFNFSLFFQDYLPKNPTVKMNLTLLYGSGLPFGPPQKERYMDLYRMPSYKRVDVGFSKMLVGAPEAKSVNFFTQNLKEAWISLEIFNLFDLNNTISYYWVSDFQNQMHAVPNYLTGRRINLKVSVSF
jgi:hypothetical protein